MTVEFKALSSSYVLSSDGELWIGSEKLGGFKEGSLTIEGDTVDNFSRDDGGWSFVAPGRRSASLEVTFLKKEDDVCQQGLRAHMISSEYQNKCAVVIFKSGTTGQGFKGDFIPTNYEESQTDGGDAVECTMSFSCCSALEVDTAPPTSS